MKYTYLQLAYFEEIGAFKYGQEEPVEFLELADESIKTLGSPDAACVYCPEGSEKKWKRKLFSYVQNALEKENKKNVSINRAFSKIKEKEL